MIRTRIAALLLGATLFSTASKAQVPVVSKILPKVDLGVKLGGNYQSFSGNVSDGASNLGLFGGAFFGIYKNKKGVQVEGLLKRAKIDFAGSSANYVKSLYLDIPVMFTYHIIKRVRVEVGPQFGMLLTAEDKNGNDIKNSFASSDISAVGGVDVDLPFHLMLGARYVFGFTDVNKTIVSTESTMSRSLQVHVGFRFL